MSATEATGALATRLEALGAEFQTAPAIDREELLDELVGALIDHGGTEDVYAKAATAQGNGAVFVSRNVRRQRCVAVFRPSDRGALPAALETSESPVRMAELGTLLETYAGALRSGERSPAAVLERVILLVANEPGSLVAEQIDGGGKAFVSSRLGGAEGALLAVVGESVGSGEKGRTNGRSRRRE